MNICEICNSTYKCFKNKITNTYLCNKHSQQIYKYGKILDRTIFDKNKIIKYKDYAEIILYNYKCNEIARTKIDLDDIEKCSKYKWGYKNSHTGYAESNHILLHRYILNVKHDEYVDHINHNTLDNRKENLRICTQSQNNMNRKNVRGIDNSHESKLWRARIQINKKEILLGYFKSEKEALNARKNAELKYFKQYSLKDF